MYVFMSVSFYSFFVSFIIKILLIIFVLLLHFYIIIFITLLHLAYRSKTLHNFYKIDWEWGRGDGLKYTTGMFLK